MNSMRGNVDERLDALLRAYRDACPTPEPSANFMPNLWQRIESRQSFTFSFQRMANAFVTAAVALSIALGVYMSIPHANSASYSQSYLEALADANTLDTPDYVSPVRLELSDSGR
jgi:hypothetical protein